MKPKKKENNLLPLSIACYVLVSFSVITMASPPKPSVPVVLSAQTNTSTKRILPPQLITRENYPELSAEGAVVIDVDTSTQLFQKDAHKRLLPASTTKIMTALISLSEYPLEKVVTVGKVNTIGQKMKLVEGENITTENLIKGLLIYSANDAAEVLSNQYLGGKDNFVKSMNAKAKELKMKNTNFNNPSGLDDLNHYSTAFDMALLAKYSMKNPTFAEIVSTKETTVSDTQNTIFHKLVNINELLGQVEGVAGIKTGWTENARENLVTYVERDGKKLIIVVLGSEDRFGETKKLIEWTYKNHIWQQ